jgi:hypothetical protein
MGRSISDDGSALVHADLSLIIALIIGLLVVFVVFALAWLLLFVCIYTYTVEDYTALWW